jgi:hypothetical protein
MWDRKVIAPMLRMNMDSYGVPVRSAITRID